MENAEEKITVALTLQATMKVGETKSLSWGPKALKEDTGRGVTDFFVSPWEMVVAADSRWFDSEGNMNIDISPSLAK